MTFKPVIIESPYAGCVPLNKAYLQGCILHCLANGETPYASHQMLTDALDDTDPRSRELGIRAGLDMRSFLVEHGATVAYYTDLGWSNGMTAASSPLLANSVYRKLFDGAFPPIATLACEDLAFARCFESARISETEQSPLGQLLRAAALYNLPRFDIPPTLPGYLPVRFTDPL